MRAIAQEVGRAPSAISRELRRKATKGAGYRPFEAHRTVTCRRGGQHRRRIETNPRLCRVVGELLTQLWSQQISRHLMTRFPDEPSMRLCHESIYQSLYQPGSPLLRPSPLGTAPPLSAADRA